MPAEISRDLARASGNLRDKVEAESDWAEVPDLSGQVGMKWFNKAR